MNGRYLEYVSSAGLANYAEGVDKRNKTENEGWGVSWMQMWQSANGIDALA